MGIGKNNQFVSSKVEYSTPRHIFEPLRQEFGIETDVCASANNAKCKHYWTETDDALSKEWVGACWMNPPFSRNLKVWVKKAFDSCINGATVVCFLPVRSNTLWWHRYVMCGEIRFICGEVTFEGHTRGLWMPQCIVVFAPARVRSEANISHNTRVTPCRSIMQS